MWLLSNGPDKICKKRQVQGHHAKVKGQMSKNCISLYLGAHKEFISTCTNHIRQNLRMTLTHFFKLWPWFQGQRSKVKPDLPTHTYGIRQCCIPSKKLLLLTVAEISSGQKFCSEGHWVKVKGQICKITSLCTTTCHDDVTYQI